MVILIWGYAILCIWEPINSRDNELEVFDKTFTILMVVELSVIVFFLMDLCMELYHRYYEWKFQYLINNNQGFNLNKFFQNKNDNNEIAEKSQGIFFVRF